MRILFDGECGLCSRTVRFFLRRERLAHFTFTPLQSDCGRQLAARYNIDPEDPSTFAVIEPDGHARLKSDGAFHALQHCSQPWRYLATLARCLPTALTDACYDFVARRRRRFFASEAVCDLPDSDLRKRLVLDMAS